MTDSIAEDYLTVNGTVQAVTLSLNCSLLEEFWDIHPHPAKFTSPLTNGSEDTTENKYSPPSTSDVEASVFFS